METLDSSFGKHNQNRWIASLSISSI